MWPSHSGCDYASICTGMRVQAGKSERPKKGTSFQLSSEEWVLIKDRQHIGSVASTAFILWHWLLDLQLWWVLSISEISIEAEALTPKLFQLSICGFTAMTHFAFEQIGGRLKLLEKPEMFSCSTDACRGAGVRMTLMSQNICKVN